MPKSYRFRTEVGVDKEVRINIEQDFDFLEILSLKLRQEDLYDRFCADYGIVAGRVVANGGFGVPNATISVFVPLDNIDANDPIISTLYPYKTIETKNDDGYRYNLLPYEQEYGGHTPTGTFPSRDDVLTRKEVLHVYEKYYRYTVKTNDSGDFMIVGVPLGQQKLVMDLDLSNMGQFSLRPADLIRMGMGVPNQFNGQQFKSSEDLNSLPQIVNSVREIEVTPFWGENDLCDVGIARADFDLRDLGIEISPQSIFMGSLFSSTEDDYLRGNCKPKNKVGKLCDVVAGAGQILSIRQTIDVDFSGQPILEQYFLEDGGNVIDENGTWMVDLPMNLDYVITNEFGEQIISLDPSVGIPTKGKYRFRIKYQNEDGINNDIIRADYLVPNIREHGWTATTADGRPSEEDRNKSYAFSLDWDEYYDKYAAINCEDSFYQFNYNKVYTVASHLDRFKWGRNRIKHLGIKEINDDRCQSEHNPLPVVDAQRNGNLLIFLFNFLITVLTYPLIVLLAVAHVITFIWPIVRAIIIVISTIVNYVLYGICLIIALFSRRRSREDCVRKEITPPPKESPFSNLALPMISYPDCEACACASGKPDESDNDTAGQLEGYADEENFGPIIDASYTELYINETDCGPVNCDECDNNDTGENTQGESSKQYRLIQRKLLSAGYDQYDRNGEYKRLIKDVSDGVEDCGNWDVARSFNTNDQVQWYKSPAYQTVKGAFRRLRFKAATEPTYAQALNLMNRRAMYFGEAFVSTNVTNQGWNTGADDKSTFPIGSNNPGSLFENNRKTTTAIKATMKNNQLGFNAPETSWFDNAFIMVLDANEDLENGQLFFFNNPQSINDPNFNTFPNGNQFGGNGITGTCEGSTTQYIYRDFQSIDPLNNVVNNGVWLYNTATTMEYKFKSGVEYFQCIKTFSPWEIWNDIQGGQNTIEKSIKGWRVDLNADPVISGPYYVGGSVATRFILDYRQNYKADWNSGTGNDLNFSIGDSVKIPGTNQVEDWGKIKIAVCVRGVDPYMPRQKIKYDLSKLFGVGPDPILQFDGSVVVEGDYFMNIPIQSNEVGPDMTGANRWRHNEKSAIAHHRLWTQSTDKRNKLHFHNSDNNGAWYYENDTLAYGGFNTRLFHKPFLFEPDDTLWQSWENYTPSKYVSIDKQFTDPDGAISNNIFEDFMGRYGQGIHAPNGKKTNLSQTSADAGDPPDAPLDFPWLGINPWFQQNIEGVGYQCSWIGNNGNTNDNARGRHINGPKELFSMSPLYLPSDYGDGDESQGVPHVKMINSQKLLFRSDRIPSSDKFDEPDFRPFHRHKKKGFRRYALHMNLKQQLFLSDDDGNVTDTDGNMVPTDASGTYLDSIEDTNCETQELLASFNCDAMVPFGCCSGSGENFGIEQPCDIPRDLEWGIQGDQRLKQGCYVFVIKKPIRSLRADIEMFFEYRTRIRYMFSTCQGVIGESFQNNWINGTLYMPTFQKQTLYNSDNEVRRYRYCGDSQQFFPALRYQGPIYFNNKTNSFYYRSTPFNDETNQFIGQEPSRDYYYGQNDKNIWFPTTIMELGPRDEFTKEIAFSPEFEGYIIDTIKSTSYQDPSDVINLFLLSRMVNTSFLEQLTNTGDASIGQLFSRDLGTPLSRLFDARVDGDFAQMVGINSEYGVVPFIDGNYCDDTITLEDDRFGIWFSSNTINRRILQNGVTTFGTNPENPINYFGYSKTQIVPYYMWSIKDKVDDEGNVTDGKLFGTEFNSWDTDYIFSSKYQGDDFFNSNAPYMKPNYGYGRGHIFNRSLNDPSLDAGPISSNNTNQNRYKVGSPFYFYFGLKRGKSAINRYITKYIFNQ